MAQSCSLQEAEETASIHLCRSELKAEEGESLWRRWLLIGPKHSGICELASSTCHIHIQTIVTEAQGSGSCFMSATEWLSVQAPRQDLWELVHLGQNNCLLLPPSSCE
jgi:hypothetical protein